MGKGGSERKQKKVNVMSEDAPVNVGASGWPSDARAYLAVRRMQTKLHGWAATDGGRRFDDLWNLVCDPAFLTMAWERVAGNRDPRLPGWTVSLWHGSLPGSGWRSSCGTFGLS